ncbi:uncharacterized [Tachysurus ichikawai]
MLALSHDGEGHEAAHPSEMSPLVSEPVLITSFIQLSHSTEQPNELLLSNTGLRPHDPAHRTTAALLLALVLQRMIFS